MSEPKRIAETALAYGAATADLQAPVILSHEGRPVAVLLSFAEYERLRSLEREAQQQRQKAWLELEAMMVATHNRPTDMTPEQIEAEIGEARAEVRAKRIGSRRRHWNRTRMHADKRRSKTK